MAVGVSRADRLGVIQRIRRKGTCNNLFHIKGGIVQSYTPIGSGGASCYTDDRARPGFSGPTNL